MFRSHVIFVVAYALILSPGCRKTNRQANSQTKIVDGSLEKGVKESDVYKKLKEKNPENIAAFDGLLSHLNENASFRKVTFFSYDFATETRKTVHDFFEYRQEHPAVKLFFKLYRNSPYVYHAKTYINKRKNAPEIMIERYHERDLSKKDDGLEIALDFAKSKDDFFKDVVKEKEKANSFITQQLHTELKKGTSKVNYSTTELSSIVASVAVIFIIGSIFIWKSKAIVSHTKPGTVLLLLGVLALLGIVYKFVREIGFPSDKLKTSVLRHHYMVNKAKTESSNSNQTQPQPGN